MAVFLFGSKKSEILRRRNSIHSFVATTLATLATLAWRIVADNGDEYRDTDVCRLNFRMRVKSDPAIRWKNSPDKQNSALSASANPDCISMIDRRVMPSPPQVPKLFSRRNRRIMPSRAATHELALSRF